MKIDIVPADRVLQDYMRGVEKLSEADARKGLVRAVNRTTDTVYTRVVRAVVRQSSIPRRIVREQTSKRKAAIKGQGEISGAVYSSGEPVPLKEFNARQFSYGVKAKVWGKMRRFETTFIFAGTFNSGKTVGGGHVFQRVRSSSLPIVKQLGPAVSSELVRSKSKEEFERTVETMLPDRVKHELSRLIALDQ